MSLRYLYSIFQYFFTKIQNYQIPVQTTLRKMAEASRNIRAVTFPNSSRRAISSENIHHTDEEIWASQIPRPPYEISKGEYIIWTRRLQQLTKEVWYDVRQVLQTLSAIRNINFGLTDDRQHALAEITGLRTDCPFAKNIRFPKHRIFMCEAESNWRRKFDRVRNALMFKTMYKTDEPYPKDMSETLLDYHEAITDLRACLYRHENVYTRDNFEEEKCLTWVQ